MVPVFVLYFIFGGFVAHLFLKLLLWNRVRGQKNEFHSWLKNDAKEIEKKILKALLNERVLTVQQIAEKLCPGMTLQQIIGNEPHLLSNIQAVLYYLADEQIVHEKSLTRGEYPYSAYYLTKEYIAFLKEKESALSIFSNPAQSQPITAR